MLPTAGAGTDLAGRRPWQALQVEPRSDSTQGGATGHHATDPVLATIAISLALR